MPHARRDVPDPRCPAHVTLRAASGVPSLRSERLLETMRNALRAASTDRFRVLEFSVQADHLHLLVEADEPTGFARGLQGLAIRVARAVNRACRRHGSVWGDRYHSRLLRSPREVRNVLVYLLGNFRKHIRGASGIDPFSSGPWFTGWAVAVPRVGLSPPVVAARTWLARVGWWERGGGLIDVDAKPRESRSRRR